MPPGLQADRHRRTPARSPAWPTKRAASTPCSSIRRSRTRRRARRSSRASRTRSAAAAATGTCTTTSAEAIARDPRARSAREHVILGLSGGVDSSVAAALIHRAIGDQLTCVFVDHGLLRLDEATQVMETFARQPRRQGDPRRCVDRVPRRARRRRRSRAEAQDHRPAVRRGVPARGGEAPGRALARAGHDLSGRDRVRRREDQEGAHDQVASQRRRPAGDAASQAARAVARAVQGRGARARARARAAARDGVPPSVPGPGPRRAHPRRGQARVRRSAAPRRCDLHRRAASCARRATASPGTTRPRRRSPCSCRCARSA